MIVDEFVVIKWNGNNKKYYESKGYKYTHHGDTFTVCIEDVNKTGGTKVRVTCDKCDYTTTAPMVSLSSSLPCKKYGFGSYYCRGCWYDEFQEEIQSWRKRDQLMSKEVAPIKVKKVDYIDTIDSNEFIDHITLDIKLPTLYRAIPYFYGGIYKFYDEQMNLLYVGKTSEIKARIRSHLETESNTAAYKHLFRYVAIMFVKDRNRLGEIEKHLINTLKPKFNKNSVYTYTPSYEYA